MFKINLFENSIFVLFELYTNENISIKIRTSFKETIYQIKSLNFKISECVEKFISLEGFVSLVSVGPIVF